MRAGIVEGLFTPSAARQAAYVTGHLPSTQSAARLGAVALDCDRPGGRQISLRSGPGKWTHHTVHADLFNLHILLSQFFRHPFSLDRQQVPMQLAFKLFQIRQFLDPLLSMLLQKSDQLAQRWTIQQVAFLVRFHVGSLLAKVGFLNRTPTVRG